MKNWVTESATKFNKAIARLRKTRPRPDEDAYAYVEELINENDSDNEEEVSLDFIAFIDSICSFARLLSVNQIRINYCPITKFQLSHCFTFHETE